MEYRLYENCDKIPPYDARRSLSACPKKIFHLEGIFKVNLFWTGFSTVRNMQILTAAQQAGISKLVFVPAGQQV